MPVFPITLILGEEPEDGRETPPADVGNSDRNATRAAAAEPAERGRPLDPARAGAGPAAEPARVAEPAAPEPAEAEAGTADEGGSGGEGAGEPAGNDPAPAA